ncbi:helix-turn-helix domain-containing protein, partial [Robinsoniella sp. RHS]
LEITEMLRTSLTLPDVTQTVHPLALKIKSYLEENFEKSVTNEILSREFGFVSSYLSKIFKNQFRMTPGNYLIKLRINKAKSLIRENPDRLIKDIADAVGYNDPYYFSKVFYKEENMWPSDYK